MMEKGRMIKVTDAPTLAALPIPWLHRDMIVHHFPSVYEKMFREILKLPPSGRPGDVDLSELKIIEGRFINTVERKYHVY